MDEVVDHLTYSAGFAGAFIDREVESRGLDFVDKEKTKYEGEPNCPSPSTTLVDQRPLHI